MEVRSCSTCKHLKYNDHWEMWFCYSDDYCVECRMWEPKEEKDK